MNDELCDTLTVTVSELTNGDWGEEQKHFNNLLLEEGDCHPLKLNPL